MRREQLIEQATSGPEMWDLIVIGGGATGLGVTLDATSRGYKTLLLEQSDFAKGTSSRSTKLVHGGVRYLAQGNISLVREALHERGLLMENAPHLVKNEIFIIPSYRWWMKYYYAIGLKLYDLLSGKQSFGRSKGISKSETLRRLPTIKAEGLSGGVVYHDGQFDDTRMAINVAQTCLENGAVTLNYVEVTDLIKKDGIVQGVKATDNESGQQFTFNGKAVINATGVFVDEIMQMDKPEHKPMVKPSQGVHLVLDKSFLPGEDAIMIPKTDDGRVLFAVPWHGKVVFGTTDTPLDEHRLEPKPLDREVDFILENAERYLSKKPNRADVKSVFAGLRPLAAPAEGSTKTKEISRSHKLMVSDSGLITITGGKWTTFRRMGQDTVDKAIEVGDLDPWESQSEKLAIHGSIPTPNQNDPLYFYGSDKEKILALTEENSLLGEKIIEDQPYVKAQVIWAVQNEMARTVEDFLARRTRVLFLDARDAIDMAPEVARLMASELDKDKGWEKEQIAAFNDLANQYLLESYRPNGTENINN